MLPWHFPKETLKKILYAFKDEWAPLLGKILPYICFFINMINPEKNKVSYELALMRPKITKLEIVIPLSKLWNTPSRVPTSAVVLSGINS